MIKPMLGKKFGRWLVLSASNKRGADGVIRYNCRCDCGTERDVIGSMLRNGLSQSCGCANIEAIKLTVTKHGLYKHRLYMVWLGMMQRCSNPKNIGYHRYGGRGIRVCKRWHSVKNFISDNEAAALPGLSIDRKDNDGDYKPSNVRWATAVAQQNNRSVNVTITFRGKTQTCAEWARELGLSLTAIRGRLRAGWSDEDTLIKPVDQAKDRYKKTRPPSQALN